MTAKSTKHDEQCRLSDLLSPLREIRMAVGTDSFDTGYAVHPPYLMFLLPDDRCRYRSTLLSKAFAYQDGNSVDTNDIPTPQSLYLDRDAHIEFAQTVATIRHHHHHEFSEYRPLVLDLGANIGFHTLAFAAMGCEVHAFEPHILNSNILRCSLARNSPEFQSRVHVYDVAIDRYISNTTALCLNGVFYNSGEYHLSSSKTSNGTEVECNPVRTIRLDDWVFHTQNRKIDVLKIDIEGFDYYAVQGGIELFSSPLRPRHLFVEYSIHHLLRAGVTRPIEYLEWLLNKGYHIINVRHGRMPLSVKYGNLQEKIEWLMNLQMEYPSHVSFLHADIHFMEQEL